jgi:hypothetical protein
MCDLMRIITLVLRATTFVDDYCQFDRQVATVYYCSVVLGIHHQRLISRLRNADSPLVQLKSFTGPC